MKKTRFLALASLCSVLAGMPANAGKIKDSGAKFNGKLLAMDENKAQNSQTITASKPRFELARGLLEALVCLIGIGGGIYGARSIVNADGQYGSRAYFDLSICGAAAVLSTLCSVDAFARIYSSVKKSVEKVDSKNKS